MTFDVGNFLRMLLDLVFQISAPVEIESHKHRAKHSRNAAGSQDPIDDGVLAHIIQAASTKGMSGCSSGSRSGGG